LLAAAAFAASSRTVWFQSPSGNIECQVSPVAALCQTWQPPARVRLRFTGRVAIWHGQRWLGNNPEDDFVLGYGRSVLVGPFRCTSSRYNGMKCILRRTGGFVIARQGVKRVG
jgi:hypothetical protein